MNYRLLLLDYFYQYLNNQGVTEATFCFLDKTYRTSLAKCLLEKQNVTVYHIKPPRVFLKEYSFNQIEGTTLEMMLDLKDTMHLSYSEFSYEMKDPYYFKDTRKMSFNTLHLLPFMANDIINVVLLVYSKLDSIFIQPSSIVKLMNKIIDDEENNLVNILNAKIVENGNHFVINNLKKKALYLSDSLQQNFKKNSNYYSIMKSNQEYNKILKQVERLEKNNNLLKKEEIFDCQLSFYKLILETKSKPLYAYQQLKVVPYQEHFTFFYLANCSYQTIELPKLLSDVEQLFSTFLIEEYDLYQYYENDLVIVIPALIEQRLLERFKVAFIKKYPEYKCVYLNTAYDIGIGVDFDMLLAYLETTNIFDKNEFKLFVQKEKEGEFLGELNVGFAPKNKLVIGSVLLDEIGTYIGYHHVELLDSQKKAFYIHASECVMEAIKNFNGTCLFFRCHYNLFSSRKIWSQLKKIQKVFSKNIILSEVQITNNTAFLNLIRIINRLHEENFQVYFDSSIFASIMLSDITHLFEGIYVEDYEMSLTSEKEDNLFKTVLTYYIKDNKKIILHQSENNFHYSHQNIYLINENWVKETSN